MLHLDTRQPDNLTAILKDWQVKTLEIIHETDQGLVSREVWEKLNERLDPETKSRASVINFLQSSALYGYVRFEEEYGKGGVHNVYYRKMSWRELQGRFLEELVEKLSRIFPGRTIAIGDDGILKHVL
jgi:hypothetical protein